MHYGRAATIVARRQQVLLDFFEAHPERFVEGPAKSSEIPSAAWINPPEMKTTRQIGSGATFEASDDPQVPPICITHGGPVVLASGDSVTCAEQIQAGTHEKPGVTTVCRPSNEAPFTHVDTQAVAH